MRIDTGVREGDTITPYYDPMIAKIIVHGETRDAALNRLRAALRDCQVAGTVTNARFLLELARHEGFAKGDVDTGLIERDFDALVGKVATPDVAIALAVLTAIDWPIEGWPIERRRLDRAAGDVNGPWVGLAGWRLWDEAQAYAKVMLGDELVDATVILHGGANYSVLIRDTVVQLAVVGGPDGGLRVVSGDRSFKVNAVRHGDVVTIFMDGEQHVFTVPDPLAGRAHEDADADRVLAPMPGLIKVVSIAVGDTVKKGAPVMVMEAMKMEYTLNAPRDGVIGELSTQAGEQVNEGAVLLVMAV